MKTFQQFCEPKTKELGAPVEDVSPTITRWANEYGEYCAGCSSQWRKLDDTPEHEQHIEIACHYEGMGVFSEVDQYDENSSSLVNKFGLSDNELIPLAWRPAGEPFKKENT